MIVVKENTFQFAGKKNHTYKPVSVIPDVAQDTTAKVRNGPN